MDFFTHQEAARKRTKLLLFYYALAVTLLVLATYAAAMAVFGFARGKQDSRRQRAHYSERIVQTATFWNPQVFAASAICTLTIVGLGALWRLVQLRSGGSAVAEMLGGRRVEVDPTDDHERKLRNVIEETAIASGTPVPEIFLLDDERGINAFAAGYSGSDTAIGVTRGCVEKLSRDELQGVIAHEFSHILNGDMRMNIRLMGVLHGILCLYVIGRILLSMRSRSSKDRNPLPLFGLALMAIGGLGVFFAHLIQAAVSRQREFLADASAVQFTRNPNGIGGALKKIGGLGSKLETPQADAAGHFFFANGLAQSWFGLTATHPPLEERIRRIDPTFDGSIPRVAEAEVAQSLHSAATATSIGVVNLARFAPVYDKRVRSESVTRRIGQSVPIQYGAGVLDTVPNSLRVAAHQPWSASALLFAFVLSSTPETRERQKQFLKSDDARLADEAVRLSELLKGCDRRVRLPLVLLSLPALRTISREQWTRLSNLFDQLVCCDGQVELFEFVLKKIVARQVEAKFQRAVPPIIQYYSFAPLAGDCALLLSALAHVGSGDAAKVRAAFEQGFARLPFSPIPPFVAGSQCGVQAIDAALTRLDQSAPHIKKTLLAACAETVASDGFISADEAELLRAIAETLDCPTPPLIDGI
ncbi:MAG TPA: M48 family metallopeptidase [Candidatus Limnocylindria bacterium]|nr:M48 family metallopeptidase [Candidatus Limnocylindria bacterium]